MRSFADPVGAAMAANVFVLVADGLESGRETREHCAAILEFARERLVVSLRPIAAMATPTGAEA